MTDAPPHPIRAEALKPVVAANKAAGKPFKMGMVFPVSTHNYELRYWLAAGGLHPGYYAPHKGDIDGQLDADVLLSVTPPPQMPATMEAGTIYGYCVGEPWNQQAVFKGIGVPVITDYEIWPNNPEKVFGMTAEFVERIPIPRCAWSRPCCAPPSGWMRTTTPIDRKRSRSWRGRTTSARMRKSSPIP